MTPENEQKPKWEMFKELKGQVRLFDYDILGNELWLGSKHLVNICFLNQNDLNVEEYFLVREIWFTRSKVQRNFLWNLLFIKKKYPENPKDPLDVLKALVSNTSQSLVSIDYISLIDRSYHACQKPVNWNWKTETKHA